eukprot:snap_masked-scaffold_1-processed-gene-16.59-mRNA-1 protein AED:0.95 eAED:0.95 QI:0/-1/0/1/-1/1/1/0/81
MVIEFLRKDLSELAVECLHFLKNTYPEIEYWNQAVVNKIDSEEESLFEGLRQKLIKGMIFITIENAWFQVNWSRYEYQMLR